MPWVDASLATADARFATSRSPMYAIAESTATEPRTMKMSAATGISARTLPRSRMARLGIEAVDREPRSIRVDDLRVATGRLHDTAAERADERNGQRGHAVVDDDRVQR